MSGLNIASLSSLFLKMLRDGAAFVLLDNAFHRGTVLLLKVYFLVLVLLYSMKSLCFKPIVVSDMVNVKICMQSMSTNPFIILARYSSADYEAAGVQSHPRLFD